MSDRLPLTVLVQGGIASGKSTIARLLEARGAGRIDCDRVAHEILDTPEVQANVRERFGQQLVVEGQVDRQALGALVFADEAALKELESWIHPRVRERVREALAAGAVSEGEARGVLIVDAAVAEKMNLTDYDLRVFVDTPLAKRRERARERGWDEDEVERREARQEPLEARRARADFVLPNEGDLAEAEKHVERFWDDFVQPRR